MRRQTYQQQQQQQEQGQQPEQQLEQFLNYFLQQQQSNTTTRTAKRYNLNRFLMFLQYRPLQSLKKGNQQEQFANNLVMINLLRKRLSQDGKRTSFEQSDLENIFNNNIQLQQDQTSESGENQGNGGVLENLIRFIKPVSKNQQVVEIQDYVKENKKTSNIVNAIFSMKNN